MNHPLANAKVEGDVVTLPRDDFDQLVETFENAQDAVAFDEGTRKLQASESELLPATFVERILKGVPPVLVWREYRDITREALAARAGVAVSRIFEMEQGATDGSVSDLKRVAAVLGTRLDDLV